MVGTRRQPSRLLPFLAHDHREDQLRQRGGLRIGRGEHEADGVLAGRRQGRERLALFGRDDAAEGALLLEQRVRNLDQDAGAVAGVGFGTGGTAMLHALERLQAAIDDVVRGLPAQVREEPDATGIVFKRRVIQAALRPPGQLRVVHWGTPLTGSPAGDVRRGMKRASSVCQGQQVCVLVMDEMRSA